MRTTLAAIVYVGGRDYVGSLVMLGSSVPGTTCGLIVYVRLGGRAGILYYCSMFSSEADFQSAFTGFLKRRGRISGIAPLAGACVFECKLLRCTQTCQNALQCVGRLKVGAHEAMQATELLNASGATGMPCVHKISDESRGVKPFDCFFLEGAGVRAYFVFAFQHAGVCAGGDRVGFYVVEPLVVACALHDGLRSVSLAWLQENAVGWGRV